MRFFNSITITVFALKALWVVSTFVSSVSLSSTCSAGASSEDQCEASETREETALGRDTIVPLRSVGKVTQNIFTRDREGKTSLPQDPKADKSARLKQLEERRKDYRWSTDGIPVGTPYLEGFPPLEEFPKVPWITQVVATVLRTNEAETRNLIGLSEIVEALSDPEEAKQFVMTIGDQIGNLIGAGKIGDRPTDITDYKELHAFPMKTPDSVYDYKDDHAFARLRLQGPNCVVLEKCSEATREKLKILDIDPAYKDLKKKVDSLMKNGKLFVVDHELLAGMPATPVKDVPRYLAAGIALFEVVDDDLLPIKPIGIQLSQGEEVTPIFMPNEGNNWEIAKACFEAADFIIHEFVSHLSSTHMVLEGPVVAMNRQLPKEHPIYTLLQPHLEGTALINWGAQNLLIVEGRHVDMLMANDIKDSWNMSLQETLKRISKDFTPMADFETRHMTKKDFPGRYPYRDFGIQYWEAIFTWVKEYLNIYYTSEKNVEEDYELKGFVDEMTGIAQMKWLDEFYTSSDKKGVITEVLASLIYTASVLHAAVNFPQRSSMSFIPSCPSSMFVPIPTDKKERTFEDYLAYLPPMEIAKIHVFTLTLLGSVYHTKLGDYEINQFDDDRVKAPLTKFQAAIEDIETDLINTNAELVAGWRQRGKDKKQANNFGYSTLLPDYVPQSINI